MNVILDNRDCMMDEQDALQLLIKYRDNQCTAQEIAAVESYFIEKLKNTSSPEGIPDYEQLEKEIWAAIAPTPVKRRIPVYVRYAAAATIIIAVITSTFYYISNKDTSNTYTTTTVKTNEIMPGGNSATLTLANGKKISLNALNGNVATNPGVLISNNSGNGVITYKANRNEKQSDEVNTINTPRGGQYQMVLSDGTKVVLNSSSTLQFFVGFTAAERTVTLTGEAYFEVAKDPKRPFLVTTKGQTVTVLGTHFNVSAYPDETIKTTLAEGSVALTSSSSLQKQLLKPDQQALLLSNNQGFKVIKVNAADEMAWKDGLFMFNQTPIVSVLRQISRWYNVDADFSNLPDAALEGEFSKTLTLSEMLRTIEYTSGIKIILTDERRLKIVKQ